MMQPLQLVQKKLPGLSLESLFKFRCSSIIACEMRWPSDSALDTRSRNLASYSSSCHTIVVV